MIEINTIVQGDCLEVMSGMADNSVDCIVTDPPYELGFMGKSWDSTGIAYNVELWREALRVVKPGGHLLAFGGTRTYHRMACAIEDAGFEIREMCEWVYGSGFPKSLDVSKAIDKIKGVKGTVVGTRESPSKKNAVKTEKWGYGSDDIDITIPCSPEAIQWEGWGTALKPAHEPICVARKPLSEKTVAANVLKWGTGGINIDACRVGTNPGYKYRADANGTTFHGEQGGRIKQTAEKKGSEFIESTQGRWPANLIHDGSDEVLAVFPETKSGIINPRIVEKPTHQGSSFPSGARTTTETFGGDSGSAARFFYCAKASKSERNDGLDRIRIIAYDISNNGGISCKGKSLIREVKLIQMLVDMETLQAKATVEYGTENKNVSEWSTGWFGKIITEKYQKDFQSIISTETRLITVSQIYSWLVFLLTNEYTEDVSIEKMDGGNLAESAGDSKELIVTISEKMALALGVNNAVSPMRLKISVKEETSGHPTVKPLALMRYLCRLVCPPWVHRPSMPC